MKPLRCGVIGAGTMGALYAKAFSQSQRAELTALVDLDEAKLAAIQESYPEARSFTSVEQLLASGIVDAVAVALPDYAHRDTTIACLKSDVHVLCEKPLAMSLEDGRAMAEAERASKATMMVNFGNRHRPSARVLKERIREGGLGDIQVIRVRAYERHTKTQSLAWRSKTDPTWFLVSHAVDLVRWLMDTEVVSVSGMGSYGVPSGATDLVGPTSVSYLAKLANGAHAVIEGSWILPSGFPRGGDFSCSLLGTEASVDVDFLDNGFHFFGSTTEDVTWDFDTPDFRGYAPGWWFTSCEYFVDCVQCGVSPQPDADDGLKVTAVLAAMSDAISTGKLVAVANP